MKTSTFYALAAAKLVASHATFQSFVIDGKNQGQHVGVREPSNGNNPILDVTSKAMICNGGTSDKVTTLDVTAGSEIGFQWHHNDGASLEGDTDEPIAASHKGPVMVYVAPAESNGEGDVWVKIHEEGLSGGKWAVDNFIANKGLITITLPDLADGEYLIRPEILALHEGNRQGAAQFYNGCGQIKVTGGSKTLPAGVDMTKAYSATDPGVLVDIYNNPTSYEIPGPAVWDGASGSGSGSGSSPAPAPSASAAPSAAPSPSATSIAENEAPSATAPAATPAPPASTAAPAPPTSTGGSGSGSGSTLPEKFTIEEFISWLEATTSPANARRFARSIGRAHARAFL